MIPKLDIYVDGKQAIYKDLGSLPLSIKRRADPYTSIVGTEGIKIDNIAGRIVFPGVSQNADIFQNAHQLSSRLTGVLGALNCRIIGQGAELFEGDLILHSVRNKGKKSFNFSAGISGGADLLFDQLKDLTFHSLDLGSEVWNQTTIESSWTFNPSTSISVWGPVWYGKLTGNTPVNNFQEEDLRPHIPFWRIIQAGFNQLGISIDSEIYQTEIFRRHLHISSGASLSTGSNDSYSFRASLTANQEYSAPFPNFETIIFDNDTTSPNHDPQGVFDTSTGIFTAPVAGNYSFESIVYIDNNPTQFISQIITSTGQVFPFQPQTVGVVGPIQLALGETVKVQFKAEGTPGGVAPAARFGSYFKGSLLQVATVGSTVELSRALPNSDFVEFLAGVSHLFGLVWDYDPIRRKAFFDPRYDFVLDGVRYPGFYKRLINSETTEAIDWTKRVDQETIIQMIERPYGDSITFRVKYNDSPLSKSARASSSSGSVPYMGAQFNFSQANKKGKVSENPYFHDLPLSDTSQTNFAYMPLFNSDHEVGTVYADQVEPTYEGPPTYGYYAGNINYSPWSWKGSTETNRPTIYQRPGRLAGISSLNLFNASYGDFSWFGNPAPTPGYAKIFYLQYLASLERGQFLEAETEVFYHEFANPEFQFQRKLKVNDEEVHFVLLELAEYKPLVSRTAKGLFIQWIEPDETDIGRLQSSQVETLTKVF